MERPNDDPFYRIRNRETPPIELTVVLWAMRLAFVGLLFGGTQIARTLIKASALDDLSAVCDDLSHGETPTQIDFNNVLRVFDTNEGAMGALCTKRLADKKKDEEVK